MESSWGLHVEPTTRLDVPGYLRDLNAFARNKKGGSHELKLISVLLNASGPSISSRGEPRDTPRNPPTQSPKSSVPRGVG